MPEYGSPSVNTSIRPDDSEVIVVGRVPIFKYPYYALSISRWQICDTFFNPNGIFSHSNRPDGVINAVISLARAVIYTTQKPLAIFNEQYFKALYISCSKSLIKGIR